MKKKLITISMGVHRNDDYKIKKESKIKKNSKTLNKISKN